MPPLVGTVAGRVLFDNAPLSYYGVSITGMELFPFGGRPTEVRSADGCFTLPQAAGTWRISIWGPGTRRFVIDNVMIESGKTVDLGSLVMMRGDHVRGYVHDGLGTPVADAQVTIGNPMYEDRPRLEANFSAFYSTVTNTSGAFAFEGIDARMGFVRRPRIRATHHHVGSSVAISLPPGDASIDLVLLGVGEIRGLVNGFRGGSAIAYADRVDEPRHSRASTVGRDGAFRFERVPAGDYLVSLKVPTHVLVTSTRVTVGTGDVLDTTIVILGAHVRVVLKSSQDVSTHVVLIPDDDAGEISPQVTHRPDSVMIIDGVYHYYFGFVIPGTYRLSIDGGTRRPLRVEASPEVQTFEII